MGGVGYTAIHGTDLDALGRFIVAHALGALTGVNHVDFLSFGDGLITALWFTGSAANALFSNLVCHFFNYPPDSDYAYFTIYPYSMHLFIHLLRLPLG
jgi:hypothetical protein